LEGKSLRRYIVEREEDALRGLQKPEWAVDQLAGIQRALRIAGRADWALTLQMDGLDTAIKIRNLGEATFISAKAESLGGITSAKEIFNRAEERYGQALALLMRHNIAFNQVHPAVVPGGLRMPGADNANIVEVDMVEMPHPVDAGDDAVFTTTLAVRRGPPRPDEVLRGDSESIFSDAGVSATLEALFGSLTMCTAVRFTARLPTWSTA
jgi:hypothetical protein